MTNEIMTALRALSAFADLAPGILDEFVAARPELCTPGDPCAPPVAPTDDIDPEVQAMIDGRRV